MGGDQLRKAGDGGGNVGTEAGAQVIPEGYSQLPACLGEAEEGVAGVTTSVGSCGAADLAANDLTADVVFGAVGMQGDFRPVEDDDVIRLLEEARSAETTTAPFPSD